MEYKFAEFTMSFMLYPYIEQKFSFIIVKEVNMSNKSEKKNHKQILQQ
jgi:hypothetical protein